MSNEEITDKEIIIRNYRTSDYQATLEILRELNALLDIGFDEKRWRESSGLRQFKPNLKRITLIAELKTGEVVSMGVIEAQKSTLGKYIGYLDNWATKKDFIGRGVGKLLTERAIQILQSWGCDSIRIRLAYGTDKKLIDIFGKAGFHPIITVLEKRFSD
ncbi:MAG: GNAT family N-acetyltransferase [Promethearchaeota archaeon]|jgi:GNAT superfamily N-acetyltransferase